MTSTIISVKVKPNSRVSVLDEGEGGVWLARLKSPPVDGKANEELVALVAQHFGCRKSAVTIHSGASARTKRVRIEGSSLPGRLRIADFDSADTDALVRMWRASFEHGVGVTDPHPIAEQAAYLHQKLLPAYRLRVAWQGSVIVGFLAASPESIAQLFVRVENIGQGIGTQLLNLAKAESSGSLWLYTFQRNTRACRFYEHNGFVAVAHGFEPEWQLADVRYRWVRPDGAS